MRPRVNRTPRRRLASRLARSEQAFLRGFTMPKLRNLKLSTLDDVIAEITRLRNGGYMAGGNWNLSQVCDHLGETVRVGLDGDEPRAGWFMRKTFGCVIRLMLWRGAMPSGAPTLPRLTPAELPEDDPERIERCQAAYAEARDFSGPLPPYPMADNMTLDRWKRLMVIHAQHHLAFLQPQS